MSICIYNRESELQEEYVRARPDRIKSLWDEYSPAKHPDFPKWLAAYLGKIARMLTEEEESTASLFGADQAPAVLCDLLIEALRPMTAALASRLTQLGSPEAAFDAYCVMEEFSRRVMSYLQRLEESRQAAALSAMFSGFSEFLPKYAEIEVAVVRAELVRLLDSVALTTRSAPVPVQRTPSKGKKSVGPSLDDELFGSEGDASDAYGAYGERVLAVAEQFQSPVERALKRAVKFAGGASVKPIVRAVVATMVLFIKHLVLKVDDLSVASGFPRDSTLTLLGGGLFSEMGNEAESTAAAAAGAEKLQMQQAVADRFSQQLEISDVDSRVLITSALRTLQAIGRMSKNFQALEGQTKSLLGELFQTVFGQSSHTSLKTLLQQTSVNAGASVGAVYAVRALHSEMNSLSELRSFLSAASSSAPAQATFAAVTVTLKKLRGAASQLLFGLCLEAPEKMIGSYAQEEVWNSPAAAGSDREKIRENMLPQAVVTQVCF
jgi:hypothetical protein